MRAQHTPSHETETPTIGNGADNNRVKLKIKCVHEGLPPCRNCVKKGSAPAASCVLAGPQLKSRTTRTASLPDTTDSRRGRIEARARSRDDLLDAIEVDVVLRASFAFARKFPELRFLHQPSFSRRVRRTWAGEPLPGQAKIRLLCAAILSLCAPLLACAVPVGELASYARDNMSVIDAPDLITVQTLLVLSMHEWGTGSGYRAWMYSGMATRMMQSLLVLARHATEVDSECHNRTFWSCFVMDRLIFCGRAQPFALSVSTLRTHWPVGEQDFAFGQVSHAVHETDGDTGLLESMEGNIDHYFGILVRGFDIWARILRFVVSGGRRQRDMCLPENHPWIEGSPWHLLYRELQTWRECKDARARYPETSVDGHAALGQAEQFGYVNLVYYLSILFLHREYIPFLPSPESEPSGPVDPPLLPLAPPSGWWSEKAAELFAASANITNLLEELRAAEAGLQTPFAGLCSFSAATMNLYVSSFPRMNLGRSEDSSSVVATNLVYLDEFRKVWAMGEGWWITIQHCQTLYEHARRERHMYRGRTRADFAALEYSIHDSGGRPPDENLSLGELRPHHRANPSMTPDMTDVESCPGVVELRDELSQVWPLWGEHQNIPFNMEGIPFEYNLDILHMQCP